jgi:formylglycine-generating enzyme required for sulfatase activity
MTERRFALIVASYQYEDSDLRQLVAPPQDAEDLAWVLGDPAIGNFQVQTLLNQPSYEVGPVIETFFADRKRDDLLLLYFSGHGIKDTEGRLYFTTTNTHPKRLRTTAIPATLINDVMRYSRSRRQVLLLDCCYAGAFAKGMVARADRAIGTKERFEGRGRVVLTASDAMQYAFEGDAVEGEGVRSVFTSTLVRGLETGEADLDEDGLISLDELYEYAHDRITDRVPQQRPERWDFGVQGRIIVAKNPHPVVRPVELPSDLQRATESPYAGVREGAVSELGHLLRGSDQGLAVAARQALEHLVQDDSRSVSAAAARVLRIVTTPPPEKAPPTLPPKEAPPSPPPPIIQVQKAPSASIPSPVPAPRAPGQVRRLLSSVPAWAWAVVGVAVVALSVVLGNLAFGGEAAKEPTPTVTPTRLPVVEPMPAVGEAWTRSADEMVMVYVPAGEFEMGSKDGPDDEQPVHTVGLGGFWIDQTEVTNAQFAAFLNERGAQTEGGATWLDLQDEDCLIERSGDELQPKDDYAAHPVIEVSWYGAAAYCEWAGARLPTEAEWEYAARGPEGRTYPWGDEAPTCDRAQYAICSGRTIPAGSLPEGASWCGALDMAGNVWEWVNDWYGDYPSGRQVNPLGPSSGEYRVLRGGSWDDVADDVRGAYRYGLLPDDTFINGGFRCARGSQ